MLLLTLYKWNYNNNIERAAKLHEKLQESSMKELAKA